MEKKYIKWLQWRLKVFGCKRIMWSQDDAAAISALCIYAVEQMRAADGVKLSPIERDWSGKVEDEAWAYLQKLPRRY